MKTTLKIARYQARDVVRGRWLVLYALFFAGVGELLIRFGGGPVKALLGLVSLVLVVVPLVAIMFGGIYVYGGREFNQLLLAQPIDRRQLFAGLYGGLALPLAAAFVLGVGTPLAARVVGEPAQLVALGTLLLAGVFLTLVFVALALLVAFGVQDKTKGLGVAVALWLALTVVYDGAVLLVVTRFAHYPLEHPMIGLMLLNPVDLARVLLLLQFDVSALMGYTGAVFQRFFGSTLGTAVGVAGLTAWIVGPLVLAARRFRRMDF